MSEDRENEQLRISQAFVVLHGASLLAALGFLAESWGELSVWLLQCVVFTGWVHFIAVAYSFVMIHCIEKKNDSSDGLPNYRISGFIVPAVLLIGAWAFMGWALSYAALHDSECYFGAKDHPTCQQSFWTYFI